jgi:hypothetical protein
MTWLPVFSFQDNFLLQAISGEELLCQFIQEAIILEFELVHLVAADTAVLAVNITVFDLFLSRFSILSQLSHN